MFMGYGPIAVPHAEAIAAFTSDASIARWQERMRESDGGGMSGLGSPWKSKRTVHISTAATTIVPT